MTEWVKLTDLRAGSKVVADAGFTCMAPGEKMVEADERGLYIKCREGRHYIDGQDDGDGLLVGLSRA